MGDDARSDTSSSDDALAALGPIGLGGRIKRLADALQAQASAALTAEGYDLTPGQVVLLTCLRRSGFRTVTGLAADLGISQPAVTRMVNALRTTAMVHISAAKGDARKSVLSLSAQGEAQMAAMMQDFLPRLAAAAQTLYENAHGDFLTQIAAVENNLNRSPLDERVRRLETLSKHGD